MFLSWAFTHNDAFLGCGSLLKDLNTYFTNAYWWGKGVGQILYVGPQKGLSRPGFDSNRWTCTRKNRQTKSNLIYKYENVGQNLHLWCQRDSLNLLRVRYVALVHHLAVHMWVDLFALAPDHRFKRAASLPVAFISLPLKLLWSVDRWRTSQPRETCDRIVQLTL